MTIQTGEGDSPSYYKGYPMQWLQPINRRAFHRKLPIKCRLMAFIACTLFQVHPAIAGETPPGNSPASVSLTLVERQWLEQHEGQIRIGITVIPPQVLSKKGRFKGLSIDYIHLLERKLGVHFTLVPYATWSEVIAAARARQIDVIFAAQQTPERLHYLLFTDPYIELPNMILVRTDRQGGENLKEMDGWRVAVSRGSAIHEYLKSNFPTLDLHPVPDELSGLRAVSLGEVDAMVVEISRASYYIEQAGILNLKVAGDAGLLYQLRFAFRNDWPILGGILDKGLAAISPDERQGITRRWISVGERGISSTVFWTWLAVTLGAIAVALLGFLAWTRTLRRLVKQRTAQLQQELSERQRAEEAMQNSEDRYRMVFENSPVAIWEEDFSAVKSKFDELRKSGVIDIETYFDQHPEFIQQCATMAKVVDLNQTALRMHEASSKEELLAGILSTFTAESFITFRKELVCLWNGATEMASDAVVKTLGGTRRNVTIHFSVCPGYEKTFAKVLVSISDITERSQMEQALAIREQQYRTLLENSPDLIVRYDTNLQRIYVNPAWEKASGLSRKEVVNVPVGDIPKVPHPINNAYVDKLRLALEEGTSQNIEFTWDNAYGKTLYLEFVIVPEYDPNRNIISVLAVGRDLTERKQAEETQKQLNRELRAISLCNQALIRAEDETSLLNEVCNTICEEAGYVLAWVGYAEQDAEKTVRPVAWAGNDSGYVANAKLSWSEDVPHGQGPAGIAIRSAELYYVQDFSEDEHMAPWRSAALQRGYHSGIALPLKDENAKVFGVLLIYSIETNAITPDEIRLMEELAGDLAFGIVALRNRVERKQAEQQLTLLNFALNKIHDEAMLIDEQAHINYANDEACRALKYPREELLSLTIPDIDPLFPLEQWPDTWRTIQEHGSFTVEGIHRTSDHSEYPVEVSASYFDYEQQGYILALARDITERKRTEHEMLRINRFLRTLSRCNEILVHAKDEQTLLQDMCRVVVEVGEFALAWVGYTDNTDALRLQAHFGDDVTNYLKNAKLIDVTATDQSCRPAVRAVQSGDIQIVQNSTADPCQSWRNEVLEFGYHSAIALPLRNGEEMLGVLSIYSTGTGGFGREEVTLLSELASDMSYGIHALRVRIDREHFVSQLQESMESTIQALASTVDLRDPYTAGHQRRVAKLAATIARAAGFPEERIQIIYLAGLIHDIGKIAIPAEILSKPGRLSDTEMSLARTHVTASYDILKSIDFPWPIARIVRQHHERMDGSGYPDGLKGKDILVEARILAVADVVEAMNTHRPYRPAMGIEASLEELQNGRGIVYDADIVDLCIRLFREENYVLE